MVVVFDLSIMMYVVVGVLVFAYLLGEFEPSRRFIKKHELTMEIIVILISWGSVVFMLFLPFLLPHA